jgi:hypothetical protein
MKLRIVVLDGFIWWKRREGVRMGRLGDGIRKRRSLRRCFRNGAN